MTFSASWLHSMLLPRRKYFCVKMALMAIICLWLWINTVIVLHAPAEGPILATMEDSKRTQNDKIQIEVVEDATVRLPSEDHRQLIPSTDARQGNVLTYYLEPQASLSSGTIPLPRRKTTADQLITMEFPNVTCSSRQGFPIDEFPSSDPFLPWIHDYIVKTDEIRFVAQNKRRCETGKGKESIMKYWEPQMSLFQPVPVERFLDTENRTRFRFSTPEKATAPETRFLCRFHSGDDDKDEDIITLSTYSIPYEFVNWRKHKGEAMFSLQGPDVAKFEFSQLIFSCPIPKEMKDAAKDHFLLDLIPIRTPPRRGRWLLTKDHIGLNYSSELPYFDPAVEFGTDHVLPLVRDSGRIANIPICRDQQPQHKHSLVVCTWTAASYSRRGDSTQVNDAPARLEEWIAFHKLAGVDHIYLYDNTQLANDDETSPLFEIALKFPAFVTHHRWPAKVCSNNRPNHKNPGERSSQYAAEAACRERYGANTEWMSFIDTDEYLVPMSNRTWRDILQHFSKNRPEVQVLKMRSSRGRPRESLLEPLADQSQCRPSSQRKPKGPLDPCLTPRTNETFLRVYNCDFIKPPRPDRFARAMKQIYRPSFVLSHFVHYSTITTDIVKYYRDFADKTQFARRVQKTEWGDTFLDELNEGTLVHAKSVLPYETMTRTTHCTNGKKGCGVGRVCPESTPFDDEAHGSSPFVDERGEYCNCWLNQHVENYWIPRLEASLREINNP